MKKLIVLGVALLTLGISQSAEAMFLRQVANRGAQAAARQFSTKALVPYEQKQLVVISKSNNDLPWDFSGVRKYFTTLAATGSAYLLSRHKLGSDHPLTENLKIALQFVGLPVIGAGCATGAVATAACLVKYPLTTIATAVAAATYFDEREKTK